VLTALAGVLIALDGIVDPMIGMNYLVSIFAAAVIGGIGNPFGAVVGALIIGLVEETSALVVSTTYRQGISFVVLILVLLMRPQGLLGTARIRR
jgi:branched-subunit amino acid ABC-type transport system permease component